MMALFSADRLSAALLLTNRSTSGPPFPPPGSSRTVPHLLKLQLLVVVRTHPFAGVQRALFQRLVDFAAGDALGTAPSFT